MESVCLHLSLKDATELVLQDLLNLLKLIQSSEKLLLATLTQAKVNLDFFNSHKTFQNMTHYFCTWSKRVHGKLFFLNRFADFQEGMSRSKYEPYPIIFKY